ncbi:MAG: polyphosphate kinase 2 [Terrimicrobiaceae bacterium]
MESVAESGQGDLEPSEPSANGEPVRDEGDGQKSEKERDEKERKKERKQRMSGAKAMAGSFPMIELVAEQVRTSVPKEVIERVRGAKKKEIISSTYPYSKPMENEEYLEEIELLEIELVKMQAWVKETGDRIVILFEGRDAAGKGGTIKRFTENLNPRGARIVALTKPSETERGQWYFQRYVEQLPTRGELVFFDRSWYNRVGVEHIMGFCSAHEYLEFMRQAPEFERMLVRSGIRLFKFWFSVGRAEQLRRFLSRAKDPLKQWKLSPMDIESLARWDEYTKAKESMLFYTNTADAPWTIVRSDDKRRARLNAMKYVLNAIPYAGKDLGTVTSPDRKVVGSASEIYEQGESGALSGGKAK